MTIVLWVYGFIVEFKRVLMRTIIFHFERCSFLKTEIRLIIQRGNLSAPSTHHPHISSFAVTTILSLAMTRLIPFSLATITMRGGFATGNSPVTAPLGGLAGGGTNRVPPHSAAPTTTRMCRPPTSACTRCVSEALAACNNHKTIPRLTQPTRIDTYMIMAIL